MTGHSVNRLKRWSCQNGELPSTPDIKSLHIYDFDNTLFKSPLPNPRLWNSYTVARLQNQDAFNDGGWWHDAQILQATGEGMQKEELKAWSGWWNEEIVELIRLSSAQSDTLTVLLTGRGEKSFAEVLRRMVSSKQLKFDMICLKPEVGPQNQRFSSTMQYKQAFLRDLMVTYSLAIEVKVYEDRPKQTKGFRDFFLEMNHNVFPKCGRKSLTADVIQVTEDSTTLDPVIEAAEVQRMINKHNSQLQPLARGLELKRAVFYTGYLVSPADTTRLLDLVRVPSNLAESEVKYMANSVLIVPRPADPAILKRIGGMGSKQAWQVTGFSFYQSCIWAVRVSPVPNTSQVQTLNHTPSIVLATYKHTKPDLARNIQTWQPVPVDKQYILQTTVGEKVQLRIDLESEDSETDRQLERQDTKRRHTPPAVPAAEEMRRQRNGNARRPADGRVPNRHRGGPVDNGVGRAGQPGHNRGGRSSGKSGRTIVNTGRTMSGAYSGNTSTNDLEFDRSRQPQRGVPDYDIRNGRPPHYGTEIFAANGGASMNSMELPYGR